MSAMRSLVLAAAGGLFALLCAPVEAAQVVIHRAVPDMVVVARNAVSRRRMPLVPLAGTPLLDSTNVSDLIAATPLPGGMVAEAVVPTATADPSAVVENKCATLVLDGNIMLMPDNSLAMANEGHWESRANPSGSKTVGWTQQLFSFSYNEVFFYVDGSTFVKVRVVTNKELADMQWPGSSLAIDQSVPFTISMGVFDCDDDLLYVIQEDTTPLHHLEVFDASGESLATITNDPQRFLLTVKSNAKQLLGVAESPKGGSNITLKKDAKPPDPWKGNIRLWQLKVQAGMAHPLTQPEKQWVMAAAVQMHAIREAERGSDKNGLQVPWQIPYLEAFSIAFVLFLCGLFYWSLWEVYHLVYPAQKLLDEDSGNPYMKGGPATPFWSNLGDPRLFLGLKRAAPAAPPVSLAPPAVATRTVPAVFV